MAEEKKKICASCKTPLKNLGIKQFHEGRRWGVLGEFFELMVSKEWLKMYLCPTCKRVEFFQASFPAISRTTVEKKSSGEAAAFTFGVLALAVLVAVIFIILASA